VRVRIAASRDEVDEVLRRDGIDFAYLDHGQGSPSVFQHGLGGDASQASDLYPSVGRLVCLECRGHGNSVPLGDPTRIGFGTMAADVVALMDVLGIGRAFVGGLSMGAGVAARVAAEHPDRVLGLVLVRPAWLDEPFPDNLRIFPTIAALLEEKDDAAAQHAALAHDPAYATVVAASPASASALRDQLDRPHARERAAVLKRMPADTPLPPGQRWEDLEIQALVIGTEGDPIHPWSTAVEMSRRLPHAQLREVPAKDAGAEAHFREVAEAISAFVE
jgi:pimeloyl-ACP methyl ester carboxylesterase